MTPSKPCLLCGFSAVRPEFVKFGFPIVSCASCGLIYLDHQMTDEDYRTFYSEAYFTGGEDRHGYADYVGDRGAIRRSFSIKLELIEQVKRPGRVLDIGCAAGFFLEEAAARGWQVYGQEVSEYAGGVAAEQFPGRVFVGRPDQIPLDPGSLDLVTLWDVVEHLENPVQILRNARKLLKPDGLLALCTVKVDSLPVRLQGQSSRIFNPPQHLYYFSSESLGRVLERAGFRVLRRRVDSKALSVEYVSYIVSRFNPNRVAKFVERRSRGSRWGKWTVRLPLLDCQVVLARPAAEIRSRASEEAVRAELERLEGAVRPAPASERAAG